MDGLLGEGAMFVSVKRPNERWVCPGCEERGRVRRKLTCVGGQVTE